MGSSPLPAGEGLYWWKELPTRERRGLPPEVGVCQVGGSGASKALTPGVSIREAGPDDVQCRDVLHKFNYVIFFEVAHYKIIKSSFTLKFDKMQISSSNYFCEKIGLELCKAFQNPTFAKNVIALCPWRLESGKWQLPQIFGARLETPSVGSRKCPKLRVGCFQQDIFSLGPGP